ncbi:thioredoxin family protein [Oceanobacillus iheyensis]|uniref:Thioredoxin family protein n=1 Tax=Oceanobacillus jordanicus TaxID=2867266 RepID=A0AAW5B866_9BACI|nr:thioredoxin family protein [Oceanobacillus jordanicus]AVQ99708.1 thioredoxin family protein [Oceanobacillus iheyensis]MCG3419607.1 thioredoxin family protein [Oceanobacillus jordanicus]NAP00455.1 thioredoxin family protein [Halomonas sp. MG34]
MNLNTWFEKGMSPDMYIESMEKHKENLLYIYDTFSLPEDTAFFTRLQKEQLRAIVLTEDWCGDAMLNIPILLHIAEAGDIDVRMLLRDQNLELMDNYLTNGKSRSIPIIIFLDQEGNEVAKWGPRAEKIQAFVNESQAKLPEKDASDYKVKFNEMILFMTKSFRDNHDFWEEVYNSLKGTLSK